MDKNQICTLQDLLDLEERLSKRFDELKSEKHYSIPRYVKGYELRKLLGGISEGWLQSARLHGMPFTKVQGLILYPLQEVMDYLEAHKSTRQ